MSSAAQIRDSTTSGPDLSLSADHAETLALLTDLLAAACPSAGEEALAAVVRRRLDAMGLASETDDLGNVLVRVEGQDPAAPRLMLAAHIDEISLVVTGIEPDGKLRVNRSGQLHPHKLGEGPVDIHGDAEEPVPGIVSFGVGHAGPADSPRPLTWSDARIITGLSPRELKQRGVRVGSTMVPPAWRRGPVLLGDPRNPLVAAWTLDDRGGVAALLMLLDQIAPGKLRPAQPLLAAFTVQEEAGCHGIRNLSAAERPTLLLAIDGAPMFPEAGLDLDGLCIWTRDAKGHSDPRLVRAVIQAAEQCGRRIQPAIMSAAWSDATAAMEAGFAPRVATFGHVRENSHGFEVARLSSFAHVAQVLAALLRQPLL